MKKIKIITLLLAILMALPMNVSATTKDQASNWYYGNASDWARPELIAAVSNGIANEQSLFANCKRNITRREFATLVVNLCESLTRKKLQPASAYSFTDTSDVNVRKAYNAGIINGVGHEKFAPNDSVTREQMAVMIHNAIIAMDKKMSIYIARKGPLNFADKANVSSWAATEVSFAYENGIITGDGINFNPKNTASIEQAVAILNRVYVKYKYHFDLKFKSEEEERTIKKFNEDEKFDYYGFANKVYPSFYHRDNDKFVIAIDGATGDDWNEGKIVLGAKNMDRDSGWYTDVDMETYLFLDKKRWYSDVGIMLRVNAMTREENKHNGYFAGIRDDGDVVFGVHSIRNGWKELKRFNTNVDAATPNKLRVKAVGSNFDIYLNDRFIGSINDSTYSSGKVGFRTWDGYAYYSDTIVKDLN